MNSGSGALLLKVIEIPAQSVKEKLFSGELGMGRKKTKFGKIVSIYLSNEVRELIILNQIPNLSEYVEQLIIKDLNKKGEELINNLL